MSSTGSTSAVHAPVEETIDEGNSDARSKTLLAATRTGALVPLPGSCRGQIVIRFDRTPHGHVEDCRGGRHRARQCFMQCFLYQHQHLLWWSALFPETSCVVPHTFAERRQHARERFPPFGLCRDTRFELHPELEASRGGSACVASRFGRSLAQLSALLRCQHCARVAHCCIGSCSRSRTLVSHRTLSSDLPIRCHLTGECGHSQRGDMGLLATSGLPGF